MNYTPPYQSPTRKPHISPEQLDRNEVGVVSAAILKEMLQRALPQNEFDEESCHERNADEKAAVEAGRVESGLAHCLSHGYFEGRPGANPVDEGWRLRAKAKGVSPP